MQKTLKESLHLQGIGLHSGCKVNLTVKPAAENTGVVFRRVDLPGQPEIKALYSNIVDTRNCSCLGDKAGNLVSTIEHIMSALAIVGIDNAVIEVDNQEIPIMDGSAKPFYEALRQAELVEQKAPRKKIKVLKTISYTDDKGNKVELKPAENGFRIKYDIEFPSKIVGHQVFDSMINADIFDKEIAPARTFTEKQAVDYLQSIGLIKGGSLDNAVVLDGETILNKEGFRVQNECVKHKVLDAIGDMYTAGYQIIGELEAYHSGHRHNNELLKLLFADNTNYELV